MQTYMFISIIAFIGLTTIISPIYAFNGYGYINSKAFTTISVESGMYSVSFSSKCILTLGYTKYESNNDLFKLPTGIPSTFTFINSSSSYNGQISLSENYILVLYNNNTNSCYTSFVSSLAIFNLNRYNSPYVLPYGVLTTFGTFATNRYLKIESTSNSTMTLDVQIEFANTPPTSTKQLDTQLIEIVLPSFSSSTKEMYNLYSTSTYVYICCKSIGGCPVIIGTFGITYIPSLLDMIGGVIVPMLICVCCGVAISIFSLNRRRKNLMAFFGSLSSHEKSTHYVPVQQIDPLQSVVQHPYHLLCDQPTPQQLEPAANHLYPTNTSQALMNHNSNV